MSQCLILNVCLWKWFFETFLKIHWSSRAALKGRQPRPPRRRPGAAGRGSVGQTWQGSFSALSRPNFARKYAFESSRRYLHNALLCTVLQSQNFSQKSPTFFRDWIIEVLIFFIFVVKFCIFLRIFDEFFSGFRAKFQKRVTSVAFQSILRKQIRKLPKNLKSVKITRYYLILLNIIHSCP